MSQKTTSGDTGSRKKQNLQKVTLTILKNSMEFGVGHNVLVYDRLLWPTIE